MKIFQKGDNNDIMFQNIYWIFILSYKSLCIR